MLVAASGLALAAAEVALRLFYDDLPSLAGLADGEYEAGVIPHALFTGPPCSETSYVRRPGGDLVLKDRTADTFLLAIGGDSVAGGQGASRHDLSVGPQVARRLQRDRGGAVRTWNLALPGAGYCSVVRAVHEALDTEVPDAMVLLLFADDLVDRALLSVEGAPVALPGNVTGPARRWAVGRSYLANLIWFRSLISEEAFPQRFIAPEGQDAFVTTLRDLDGRLDELGVPRVVALLGPVALPRCPDPPNPGTPCEWMPEDLALLGRLLTEAGVEYVDLHRVWEGHDDVECEWERDIPLDVGIPVHPNDHGHALLADARHLQLVAALDP